MTPSTSSETTKLVSILLVEDHLLTRQSMAFSLRSQPKYSIIGEATTGKEAIILYKKYKPDLVLMDIMLPGMSGLEATQAIKQGSPDAKIIMLTSLTDREKVFSSFSSGAHAYCSKSITSERLFK